MGSSESKEMREKPQIAIQREKVSADEEEKDDMHQEELVVHSLLEYEVEIGNSKIETFYSIVNNWKRLHDVIDS